MRTLLQDAIYALRLLKKTRGVTLVAILTLALGIGANTAIFSFVHSLLLSPLPFPEPDRLVAIWQTSQQMGEVDDAVAPANFLDWREQNDVFTDIAVWRLASLNLSGEQEPLRLRGARVSSGMFEVLGVAPTMGRTFTRSDDQHGTGRVVILSDHLWKGHFAADPEIVGRAVNLSEELFTVVGVMPEGFDYPYRRDCWIPTAFTPEELEHREWYSFFSLGRLKEDVSISEAQAAMDVVAARLEEQYPDTNTGIGIHLIPLHSQLVENIRPALLILMGVVGLVLLIACANLANLLLSRALSRHREVAVRTALGASRGRVVRQMLTESVLLSLVGGCVGLLVAYWTVDLFLGLLPIRTPSFLPIEINGAVLAFTLVASTLTGVAFGLVPALFASRPDLNAALKEGDRGTSEGRARFSPRNILVVTEVALSLVILIGAGLLTRSFQQLLNQDPGFVTDDVFTTWTIFATQRYEPDEARVGFVRDVRERLQAIPGVDSVGATDPLPMSGSIRVLDYWVEGRPLPDPGQALYAGAEHVIPGYFETLRIPLIRGRLISDQDDGRARKVAVINESMAREGWPNEDPIGTRVTTELEEGEWFEIVGVVGDVQHFELGESPEPRMYFPYAQYPTDAVGWVVRSQLDGASAAPLIREAVWEVDAAQPLTSVRDLEESLMRTVAVPRATMIMTGFFAAVALVLAIVGIYGVLSYAVSRRTREIGIRMALGARRTDILRDVIAYGSALTVVGVVLGLAASFGVSRLLTGLLYEVRPTDAMVFVAVPLILMAVALLACYIPASRASKINPTTMLHYE